MTLLIRQPHQRCILEIPATLIFRFSSDLLLQQNEGPVCNLRKNGFYVVKNVTEPKREPTAGEQEVERAVQHCLQRIQLQAGADGVRWQPGGGMPVAEGHGNELPGADAFGGVDTAELVKMMEAAVEEPGVLSV
jgi:hypothetical protein